MWFAKLGLKAKVVGVLAIAVLTIGTAGVVHARRVIHDGKLAASAATRDSVSRETNAAIAERDTLILTHTIYRDLQRARADTMQTHVDSAKARGKRATDAIYDAMRAESEAALADTTVQHLNTSVTVLIAAHDSLTNSVTQFQIEKTHERARDDSLVSALQSERVDNARAKTLALNALDSERAKPRRTWKSNTVIAAIGGASVFAVQQLVHHVQVKK